MATTSPARARKTAAAKDTAPPAEKKAPSRRAPAKRAAAEKAPAKKTPARKTAATEPGKATKKATTSAARTKTTPAAAKKASAWPEFITHKMITAHHQARLRGLPTRNIRDWRDLPDGTAAIHFPSGARLDHTPTEDAPFHANTPCPAGSIHRHPVRTPADLADAEKAAKDCTEHTATAAAVNIAVTRVNPTPEPTEAASCRRIPTWALQLPGDGPITKTIPIPEEPVVRATASAAQTQPMPLNDIADGLAARTADSEQPKEHPEP
jgi:hypothetical protein